MANEDEMIVAGGFVAFFGLLLIISPIIDNLFTLFIGIKDEKLLFISLICLFGGISVAIVAAVTKKSS